MNLQLSATGEPNSGRLITGRQSPGLKETLFSLTRQVQQQDPMAPITIVPPNQYAALSLRQELGRSGFFNIRFIQLPVLSELLGGAALSAQGRKPLTAPLESILLRETLGEALGTLESVKFHPKTQASFRASCKDLRHRDDGYLADLAGSGGIAAEVIRLYRLYRQKVAAGWYDADDLTEAAARTVETGKAAALVDLGHIVFYLPYATTFAAIELMQALAQRGLCSVILGATGDPDADLPLHTLADALTGTLGPPQPSAPDDASLPLLTGKAQLEVAPNTHEELRTVARQIMQQIEGGNRPLHRMAVLYRMENPYAALIRDELEMAGIPTAGPDRDALAETPAGRTLLGLLQLAEGAFRRDTVMSWLTGCPVSLPQDRSLPFNPSRWDAISREAGIVGGLDQWKSRLAAYAAKMEKDAESFHRAGEINEARAAIMRENAAIAQRLPEFIADLAQRVIPPRDSRPWSDFCDWAENLLETYASPDLSGSDPTIRQRFDRSRQNIGKVIQELRSADSIKPYTTAAEFEQTLVDALQAPVGHWGITGSGVFVAPFGTASGMNFDVVWLVGMIEGGTPPAVRPDPMLPELPSSSHSIQTDRRRPAEARNGEERYAYLSAVAAAPRRILSYPVGETGSRREAHPSRWYLEQATALAGASVRSGNLSDYRDRPWLTVTESAEMALANLSDGGLADVLDYRLNRLLQWRDSGRPPEQHPLTNQGTLFRAKLMGQGRSSDRLTEYDGNLSQVAAQARFGRGLTRAPISATRMESWAACPFRYFLGYALRLGELETPEDADTINSLERGSLIHRILERFFAEINAEGKLPAPDADWSDIDRELLLQIAEAEFALTEASGVTGRPLLWKLTKLDIREDLLAFLEKDFELRARHQTGGVQVETRFGFGRTNVEVVDSQTRIRFRGIIDRMDASVDGSSVLVVDYKTGSTFSYQDLQEDPIDRGKHLQLGVYSLAAKQLAPRADKVEAAYWFPTARGDFRMLPIPYFNIDVESVARRFQEGVQTIVSGIEAGVFPANPGKPGRYGPENCAYCDFRTLCPARREEIWQLKMDDPVVSAYRRLAAEPTTDHDSEDKAAE